MLSCPRPCVLSGLEIEPTGPVRSFSGTEAIVPSREVAIIGRVIFMTHRDERAEAILDVDGRWNCPVLPVLNRVLNALYEPRRTSGGDMRFGHSELIRVAVWLKGEARIHPSSSQSQRRDHGR